MKIKVSKHRLNIYYRGSPRGSRTQQLAYCLRYAYSQHIESHFGKKQQQAKIPIAFLFSQLHFNNVTSHALFYGDHLVMRSKRCAVQNQGITLKYKTVNRGCLKNHFCYFRPKARKHFNKLAPSSIHIWQAEETSMRRLAASLKVRRRRGLG